MGSWSSWLEGMETEHLEIKQGEEEKKSNRVAIDQRLVKEEL